MIARLENLAIAKSHIYKVIHEVVHIISLKLVKRKISFFFSLFK